MPFYEYECPSCHRQTEVMQKISDKPLKKCPACGKPGLVKLVSAPVFRLKGSGWYETDFKSDKEGKRNLAGGDDAPAANDDGKAKTPPKGEGEGKGDAAGKGEAKVEAKSEAKTGPKAEPRSEPKGAVKSSASKSRARPAAKRAPTRKPKPASRRGGKR
jgi:putative FmdB family regulatory protein